MVEEFKKSYKNGFEVMLKPEERDQLVEYIRELECRIAKMKAYFPNDFERKEKIEKAIEYINKNEFRLFYKEQSCVNGATNLLEILKGEDKE